MADTPPTDQPADDPHADAPPGRQLALSVAFTLLDEEQGAQVEEIVTRHAQNLLAELDVLDGISDLRGTWAGRIRVDLKP